MTPIVYPILVASLAVPVLQSDPDPTYPNQDCIKMAVCRGLGNGDCDPQGIVCLDAGCAVVPGQGIADPCQWTYIYYCDGPTSHTCVHITLHELFTNCAPTCVVVSYNHCACACTNLGAGTVEGGAYRQCNQY